MKKRKIRTRDVHERIAAVCAIDGVCVHEGKVIRIDFQDSATEEQKAAAQALADAFDPEEEIETVEEVTLADLLKEVQKLTARVEALESK